MITLPKFHETFIPILKVLSDGKVYHYKDLVRKVRDEFYSDLPSNISDQVYDTTGLNVLSNRIGWGFRYLKQGKIVIYPRRGHVQITDKGKSILKKGSYTLQELKQDKDWIEHEMAKEKKKSQKLLEDIQVEKNQSTPDELISQATSEIESEVQSQILDEIQKISYQAFEVLVVKLLVAMGYGTEEFSINTSYTNDGGIDGIIQADELGFEKIYVQAKKYTGNIGRPDIQKFVGAMTGTQKGVFITTSDFAKSVQEYISTRPESIMLINGQELVELMYKYSQGVSIKSTIEIKSLDSDFWEELS